MQRITSGAAKTVSTLHYGQQANYGQQYVVDIGKRGQTMVKYGKQR